MNNRNHQRTALVWHSCTADSTKTNSHWEIDNAPPNERCKVAVDWFPRLLAMFVVIANAMQLAACTRTVHWEEEVPLNTGATVVVKRTGSYTYEAQAGNPLKFGYRPNWHTTIEFTYQGKHYSHANDAALVLLAIAPDGTPNLIADARGWGNQHEYPCVTPYYVQFQPDSTGNKWTWGPKIEVWLYNQPTNLVFGVPPIELTGKRYSEADRNAQNASLLVAAEHYQRIDPTFRPENCIGRR